MLYLGKLPRYPTVTLMDEIDESIQMVKDNLTGSHGAQGASLEDRLARVRSILLLGARRGVSVTDTDR